MDKFENVTVESDRNSVRPTHRDLKGNSNIEQSNCLKSEKSKGLEKSVLEDKNCNITLLAKDLNEKCEINSSVSSSCSKNRITTHEGPNGLVNGIDIGSDEKLTNLLDNLPNSSNVSGSNKNVTDSSSSHNVKSVKKSSENKSEHLTNKVKNVKDECNHNSNDVSINSENKTVSKDDAVTSVSKSEVSNAITGTPSCTANEDSSSSQLEYVSYKSELQMPDIMRLIQKDLSEPYSIYTYRYFIHNWPKLCFLAMDGSQCVGAIVCKLDIHRKIVKRGYIAMLAVDEKYRKRKIGSNLVLKAIRAMVADEADEVVLETEITNQPALRLYENLGFVRDKRLFRYYLNGVDALRLKLWLR